MTAVEKEFINEVSRVSPVLAAIGDVTQLVQEDNAFGIYRAERFKRQRYESVRIRQRLVFELLPVGSALCGTSCGRCKNSHCIHHKINFVKLNL